MAFAKKCDRCKKFYENNNGIKSVKGCFVRTIKLCTNGPYEELDLCDDCIGELYKFLNKED